MKNIHFRVLSVFLVFFLFVSNVYGYWVWSPSEGRFISPQSLVDTQKTAEELFQGALKLRDQKGKERDTIRMLQHVVRDHSQSVYAPEAQFLIAVLFEEQEKPLRAVTEFKKLVREFPRSSRIEEAVEHLFKTGNFFLTGEKQKIMGVAIIPVYSKAVDVFKFIVEQAPYGPYGDQAQLKLGVAYRKLGNFSEAVNAYQTLIANYPDSPLVDEAHYQLAETSYELSQSAIRDQSTTSQASAHLKDFIRQYGSSSLAERAKLLKQRLDEQDAEKNYRVGLYYEKQGAIESALIYYEDVAKLYPETPFGKKAAQRLQTLEQPIHAVARGQAAIQQRIAEVRSILEALEQQDQKKVKDQKAVSETGELKAQLKQELTSLLLGQKKIKNEAQETFASRKRAFKEREKNLRQKFKIFKGKKKQLSKNPSPELQEVIDRWQASLIAEQEELNRERQTINELKSGFKSQRVTAEPKKESRMFGWIPDWRISRKEQAVQKVGFDDRKWNKFQKERSDILHKRQANQEHLRKIEVQFKDIEQREFDLLSNIPDLTKLFSGELNTEKEKLVQKKSELDQSIQTFEQSKKEFQEKFGSEFIKNLNNESKISKLAAANSLIASGVNLEQHLTELQTEQASLSEAWLAETEKSATMAKAFEEVKAGKKPTDENLLAGEGTEATDQVKHSRLLKKRMKYLEREIRSRIDQIQDWQRDNAKRMKQLNQLLKPEGQSSMNKAAGKITNPAKGAYKLTKAFFLGLENNDQKLIEQADAEVKKRELEGNASDRTAAIRELQEEIELQSILIQGRSTEINELQGRLSVFQKEAKSIPGFSYQSLLIERIPTDLAHTVSTAKKLVGFGAKDSDIRRRLGTQNKGLSDLEQKITEHGNQIEIVNLAMTLKNTGGNQKAAVLPFVSGTTETLPQEGSTNQSDEQNKAQTRLIQMQANINILRSGYEQSQSSYQQKVLTWYQTTGQNQLGDKNSSDAKNLLSQKLRLQEEKEKIQTQQGELLAKEVVVVQSQKGFSDQKLNELEDRLEKLKNPSDSAYQALMSDIKNTQELRDSLIRDLSTLQSS